MRISELFKIAIGIFWVSFLFLFITETGNDLIDQWLLFLLFLLGIALLMLINMASVRVRPLIFMLVVVIIACYLQRILMLAIDPGLFVSKAVTLVSLETLNSAVGFLLLSVIVTGAGIILSQWFIREPKDQANAEMKNDILYKIRYLIMAAGFFSLAIYMFGILVLHEGIAAVPAGAFGWLMLLLSPVPFIYLSICILVSKKLSKKDAFGFVLLVLGYVLALTLASSKGAFISVIVMWLTVRFVREGDFVVSWKQLAGILVLIVFLLTFFAGFATGLRYLWIRKEFSLDNVMKTMYDPSMRDKMGIQQLSSRMSSFDALIAGVNSFGKINLQDLLPLTDVFKMMINNLIPGDVFDPNSLQLGLGQLAVVVLENPDSYKYFRAGTWSHAGNWGGIFNLAFCYSGWLGGLGIIFVFALLAGIIYRCLARSPSSSKYFYQTVLLTTTYGIWQAGNPDMVIPIFTVYLVQGFIVINIGRILLGSKRVPIN
jgi:hypothetical protein